MLNDYKPTHDPGLDTFKVQYLIGGSAVLAILFPYKYSFLEVGRQFFRYYTRISGFRMLEGNSQARLGDGHVILLLVP